MSKELDFPRTVDELRNFIKEEIPRNLEFERINTAQTDIYYDGIYVGSIDHE